MINSVQNETLQPGTGTPKRLLSLGGLLIDMIPGTEGMLIRQAGPVI